MFTDVIQNLIDQLSRLPGVGPKSAQRIALWLINSDESVSSDIAESITEARKQSRFCKICFNISEQELCNICSNPRRDETVITVVEDAKDLVAIEKTHEFQGLYHVLGGSLNAVANIFPEDLHVKELIERLRDGKVQEIIIATNPNIEGEVTASYLAKIISPIQIKVTRIALGLPMGSDLEFADQITLGRAFETRTEINVD